jgi:hypothetical protein
MVFRRKAKAAGGADSDCAEIQHCHQAKENGLAPDKCVIGAGLRLFSSSSIMSQGLIVVVCG